MQNILEQVLVKSWNYQRIVAIAARLAKAAITRDRSQIRDLLKPAEIDFAAHLLFAASMKPTEIAIEKGDLTSLRPFRNGGIVYTKGRVGRSLELVLGMSRLPILMPSTRLAKILMWSCHAEDHRRQPSDALARTREKAWIVRGASLAKYVAKHCPICRLESKKTAGQIMADIPVHQTTPCPPFTHVSLDFLGPYKVRCLGNQRARIKVYGWVIVCQNVRVVKLLAVPGYDTYSFLLAYSRFTSNYGSPSLVVSDRGSQLVKAGSLLTNDLGTWDWNMVSERAAKSGIKWLFVEPGCQWRNGIVERQVGILKRSMMSVLDVQKDLTYPELETLFASAANMANQQPLGVKIFTEDDVRSITPNDLLLGRNRLPMGKDMSWGDHDNLPRRLEIIQELEDKWWSLWMKQVFPSLVPYKKWKVEHRNTTVGDIVLVKYTSKVDKGDY